MTHEEFEKELADESERLEIAKKLIEEEILKENVKIERYTKLAWYSVYLGAAIGFIALFHFPFLSNTSKEFGGLNLLGDFLAGSVGSIWSLSGLFFVYIAFLGQKVQILHQRIDIMAGQQEIKYTRLQIMGQKKEMEIQNETLQQQNFENTFFQLLKYFNSTISNLKLVNQIGTKSGIGSDAFKFLYDELKSTTHLLTNYENKHNYQNASVEQMIISFSAIYDLYKTQLSVYFKTLYLVLELVDSSKSSNKELYMSIIRAQLSSYELIILFYHGLCTGFNEDYISFIEEYDLLCDIDRKLVFNESHLLEYDSLKPITVIRP